MLFSAAAVVVLKGAEHKEAHSMNLEHQGGTNGYNPDILVETSFPPRLNSALCILMDEHPCENRSFSKCSDKGPEPSFLRVRSPKFSFLVDTFSNVPHLEALFHHRTAHLNSISLSCETIEPTINNQ